MSGPMAASFGLEVGILLAAESILQGAEEIAAGLSAADRTAAENRQQRRAERQQMRAAKEAGIERRRRDGDARSARLNRLLSAWQKLGQADADIDIPVAPDAADAAAHAAYLATLDAHIARLEALLAQTAVGLDDATRANLDVLMAASVSAETELAAFLAQARLAGADATTAAARRELVARVLERLERDTAAPLPAALDQLATAIVQAATAERAETLATELRYRVQQHNAAHAAAAEEARLRAAAAVVLEQSLQDLGYAVEEIEETLFVAGGIAHFQRPEWGDYFIRLRIDPKRGAMNFNVVRAGTAGEDRKREDMLAEERWCSEFPRLFETLKARGIPISVTRLLQAGEAPVQVVAADSLPTATAEEYRRGELKARSLP